MKHLLILLACAFAAAAGDTGKREAAALVYRKQLAKGLEKATAVQVFLLDFDADPTSDATFPIKPYKTYANVLKAKWIKDKEKDDFLTQLRRTLVGKATGESAFCHLPVHGVRVYRNKTVLFESSFCWACGNYYVDYNGNTSWEEIGEHKRMKAAFDKSMPIPQSELDRFNKQFKSRPNRH